jgi:hypothetical protein
VKKEDSAAKMKAAAAKVVLAARMKEEAARKVAEEEEKLRLIKAVEMGALIANSQQHPPQKNLELQPHFASNGVNGISDHYQGTGREGGGAVGISSSKKTTINNTTHRSRSPFVRRQGRDSSPSTRRSSRNLRDQSVRQNNDVQLIANSQHQVLQNNLELQTPTIVATTATAQQLLQQQQQQQHQQLLLQQQEKQKQHLRQQLEAVHATTTSNSNNNVQSSFPIAYVDIVSSNQHEQESRSFGIVATEEEFGITNTRSGSNDEKNVVIASNNNNTGWNTNNNWLIGGCCGIGMLDNTSDDRDEEKRNKKTSKKKKKSSTKKTNRLLLDQSTPEGQQQLGGGGGSMAQQYEAKLERMVEEHELEIKKLKSELIKTQLGSSPTGMASSNINAVAVGSVVGSSGGGGGGGGFSLLKKPFKNLGLPTTAAGGGGVNNSRKPFSDASTIHSSLKSIAYVNLRNIVTNGTVPTTVTTAALNHTNNNNNRRPPMNDMRRTAGQQHSSSRRGQSSQLVTSSTRNKSRFSSASSVISTVTNTKGIYKHMKEETATMKKAWALSSGPAPYRSTNGSVVGGGRNNSLSKSLSKTTWTTILT